MANNPLYPGYSPKKEGGGSVNPLYPGYYTGNPISKRSDWRRNIPPAEYSFDVLFRELDAVGDQVSNAPFAGPKWIRDRVVNDWKDQLKVSVTPEAKLDVTELDDYATDDLAGATATLSLNPKDWGVVGDKKGFEQTKKQIGSTLKTWVKETTGVNLDNLLESDFSDIQNSLNEKLWNVAMGYGEEKAGVSERLGAKAITDRTTAMFSDVRKSAYTDEQGNRLSPLDLKHFQNQGPDGTVEIVEDHVYEKTAKAASNFVKNRDNARSRDSAHTTFLSEAMKAVSEDISKNLKTDSLSSKQKAAVDFFNTEKTILKEMEGVQEISEKTAKELTKYTYTQKEKWQDENPYPDGLNKSDFIDKQITELAKAKKEIAELKINSDVPKNKVDFFNKEIERYNSHIDELTKVLEKGQKNGYKFSRNDIKRINSPTPKNNFNSRTTFQESLGGNLRKDMERSMLSNKESDIGSVINAEGSNLRAKKLTPVIYRLRQDRIRYSTKEVLDQFDKGGLAQVAEAYVFKAIKNSISARWERASSGSIVGDALKRSNYFGLKIDDRGTPTDYYFEKHPWKKASFERRFGNKVNVKLDKELRGSIGGITNKIRVTGSDVSEDRFKFLKKEYEKKGSGSLKGIEPASLAIIGDKTFKNFKFDKSTEDQILIARLINNDRSEDALNKLSQKMFKKNISDLNPNEMGNLHEFFTKIDYANNWVYQKSGGKIKALGMQKGVLNLNSDALKDFLNKDGLAGVNKDWLKIDKLYIDHGKHLDILYNGRLGGFLQGTASLNDKEKILKDLLNKDGLERAKSWKETIILELFGKKGKSKITEDELKNGFTGLALQLKGFKEYLQTKRDVFGDVVDNDDFVIKMFLQFKEQGVTKSFGAVGVNENDKSFLVFKNIFQKNEKLNKGYRLTEKRYMGRLERFNNRMQTLQKWWNKSLPGKIIKFVKNWQEIIAEKFIALLSKLLAKLTGITAAALGPLAFLGPMLQGLAEKVIKKGLEYGSALVKAIFKLDFDSLDKMLQADFKKLVQLILLTVPCCAIITLPVIFLVALIVTVTNPTDPSRSNLEGYGRASTTGQPDNRVFSCTNACGESGSYQNDFGCNGVSFEPGEGGFYYNQCDPRWGTEILGGGSETVCSWGCYATSIAMVYTYFANIQTPSDINQLRDGVTDRFYDNGAIKNPKVIGTNFKILDFTTDDEMRKFFVDYPGGILIVGLKDECFHGDTHFVVLTKWDDSNGDFIMYDPIRGPDALFHKEYPDANIYKAQGYSQKDGENCDPNNNPKDPIKVNCSLKEDPNCINRPASSGNTVADKALEIACYLRPGFGCLFNRPLFDSMPAEWSHTGNVKTRPGKGAELFDFEEFARDPSWHEELHDLGHGLFWCTWLPIKVYNTLEANPKYGAANYGDGGEWSLWADRMCENLSDFGFRRTDTPSSGDLACFGGHVGVVYRAEQDGVYVIESNGFRIYNWYSKSGGKYQYITHFGTRN